jgi:topoisomerase IA-like protein
MSKKRITLTPEQQRERTLASNRAREMAHSDCEMEMRVRGGNYGLYCQHHDKWITWIRPQDLTTLANQGVYL